MELNICVDTMQDFLYSQSLAPFLNSSNIVSLCILGYFSSLKLVAIFRCRRRASLDLSLAVAFMIFIARPIQRYLYFVMSAEHIPCLGELALSQASKLCHTFY